MKIPQKITNLLISQLILLGFKQLNRLFSRPRKNKPEPEKQPPTDQKPEVQPEPEPAKKPKKTKKTGWTRNYSKRRYKNKMPDEAFKHIGLHIV